MAHLVNCHHYRVQPTSGAFIPSFPSRIHHVHRIESSLTPLSAKRIATVAQNGLERAKLIADSVSRESVGSAETNPVSAAINLSCGIGETILHAIPTHAHWPHVCCSALHIVSNILTASAN